MVLAALDVAEGLEATLFAAEPLMLNPTNIDIDHRGRVWVCEVQNYRGRQGTRPEGDRILILEDTDGDGQADKKTVFYQGNDIDSAVGICVLGNRVIVSCSPLVMVLIDDDGDDRADRKEILFSNTGEKQHDHSAHAVVFGPDGKLYWNFGNTGHAVHDKDGQIVVDTAGNEVRDNARPYRQGMAFRCNPDGSEFEVLGHNFRNNYELAVDSFGTIWQSDNDDDGNRGVRINYVMEFGNYGYTDEMTGAGWRTPRTNMEVEIADRHWHQNDPGVVPNFVHTGNGSPTGILVYEGALLPQIFQNQVIHCDAGPNIVRAYPATDDGAGYKGEIKEILHGARDNWFRPSDVAVAPDGSLIIADWYDPGVGGHGMGDVDRGRLFRVAPPGAKYTLPRFDFSTAEGAVEALKSPSTGARNLAWIKLHEMGRQAEPALQKLYTADNPRYRARALWLLGKIEGRGPHYVQQAITDQDANLRIVGLRLARQLKLDVIPLVQKLARDRSPQVRRECAIALRHHQSPEASELWAELALQHDGQDRWYLEALGIGADQQWDAFLTAWLARVGDKWDTPAGRDLLWRSRAEKTPEYLVRIISNPTTSADELPRYFRAFDFQQGEPKQRAIVELALGEPSGSPERVALISREALTRLENLDLAKQPERTAAVERGLKRLSGSLEYVQLVAKLNLQSHYPQLLAIAQRAPDQQLGVEAMTALLAKNQTALIEAALKESEIEQATNVVRALENSADGRAMPVLLPLVEDAARPMELRRAAARALAKTRNGAEKLLELARADRLDPSLKSAASMPLNTAPWKELSAEVAKHFPLPAAKDDLPLPPLTELLKMAGNAQRGKEIFINRGTCANCHVVGGEGKEVGPDLSEIGSKLSREAFFESILYPSAGISHNYETYALALESGNIVTGILTSRTEEEVTIKTADALVRNIKTSEIEEMKKLEVSIMPADLQKTLTAQDLADVVEYLTTLKQASK